MIWILMVALIAAGAARAETVLFDWSEAACERWDIPDTPARFWRDGDGVAMISGSERSRTSRGASPLEVRRDCDVLYEGAHDGDPQAHNDRVWIAATWAHADGRIEALAHAEYHGDKHGACDAGAYLPCWRNAILALESTDGERFVRAADTPVAALPYVYDPGQTRRSGYFSPSNIFRVGEHLHAFVFAARYADQRRGACLLRKPVDGGPESWRAWDGIGFDARLSGPGSGTLCAPVRGVRSALRSVVHDGRGGFLALTPADFGGVAGIWLQRSRDLVSWRAPELLVELPLLWRRDCAAPAVYGYPALVAPDSRSRNFDTIEGAVWLTLVEMPLRPGCKVGPERDLLAWPLTRTADGGFAPLAPAP